MKPDKNRQGTYACHEIARKVGNGPYRLDSGIAVANLPRPYELP